MIAFLQGFVIVDWIERLVWPCWTKSTSPLGVFSTKSTPGMDSGCFQPTPWVSHRNTWFGASCVDEKYPKNVKKSTKTRKNGLLMQGIQVVISNAAFFATQLVKLLLRGGASCWGSGWSDHLRQQHSSRAPFGQTYFVANCWKEAERCVTPLQRWKFCDGSFSQHHSCCAAVTKTTRAFFLHEGNSILLPWGIFSFTKYLFHLIKRVTWISTFVH